MIDEEQLIKFLSKSKYGMTTTEVARNFGMRYDRVKNMLEKFVENKKIEKIIIGNQIFWKSL